MSGRRLVLGVLLMALASLALFGGLGVVVYGVVANDLDASMKALRVLLAGFILWLIAGKVLEER